MAIKYHPDKQSHLGKEARERTERRFKVGLKLLVYAALSY
jgi:preprotein translocase subunit Sec63